MVQYTAAASGNTATRRCPLPTVDRRDRPRLWLARLRTRPIAIYYLASPLFALLDFAFRVNLRVVFLAGHPELRVGSYLGCLVLGWAILRASQRTAALVGLTECTFNLLLLTLSVMVPLADLPARVMDGGPATNPFTPLFVANLAISSAVFLRLFYANPIVRNSPRLDR